MPPKSSSDHDELKVRIPRDLMARLREYQFVNRLDSRKAAVVRLFNEHLPLISDDNNLNNTNGDRL